LEVAVVEQTCPLGEIEMPIEVELEGRDDESVMISRIEAMASTSRDITFQFLHQEESLSI
jgi:hypothetical protein